MQEYVFIFYFLFLFFFHGCYTLSAKLVSHLDGRADKPDTETWIAEEELHQLPPLTHVSKHCWTEETGLELHHRRHKFTAKLQKA